MRGIQRTDANGIATFQTVYPGWYQGRAVHIHIKVHVGGNVVHTGQLFFRDALTDAVYKKAPYSEPAEPHDAERRRLDLRQRRQQVAAEREAERLRRLRRDDRHGRPALIRAWTSFEMIDRSGFSSVAIQAPVTFTRWCRLRVPSPARDMTSPSPQDRRLPIGSRRSGSRCCRPGSASRSA